MANISVTYSFSNGSTADATEVNTNFQDIIDGTSDGTKDFSISALTCAGALTANGNATLGNATADDVTITGRIAADIDPKTASATDLGDSTQLWRHLYLHNVLAEKNAAADPTYSFHGDTDTGLWSSAANTIDLAVGGASKCIIDTNGLGIGASPVSGVDLFVSSASPEFRILDSDGTAYINITTDSVGSFIYGSDPGAAGAGSTHTWKVDNATAMTLNASKQLGVGVVPSTPFHLKASDPIFRMEDSDGSSSIYGEITTNAGGTMFIKADPGNAGAGSSVQIAVDAGTKLILGSSNETKFPDAGTTGSAANAFLDSGASNNLLRSTSSLRYKTKIRDIELDTSKIFDLRPVTYKSKAKCDKGKEYFGLVAEEVAKIYPDMIHWAPEKMVVKNSTSEKLVPDGIAYDRLAILMLCELKKLRQQLQNTSHAA
jgi:hypothetical protein